MPYGANKAQIIWVILCTRQKSLVFHLDRNFCHETSQNQIHGQQGQTQVCSPR